MVKILKMEALRVHLRTHEVCSGHSIYPPPPPLSQITVHPRTRGIGNPQKYLDHTFHSSPPHVRSRYPAMLWYRYGKHGAPETTWTLFRSSIKDGIDGARGILREDRFVGPCVFCWRVKASMRSRKRSPGLNPERLSGVGKSNLPQQCRQAKNSDRPRDTDASDSTVRPVSPLDLQFCGFRSILSDIATTPSAAKGATRCPERTSPASKPKNAVPSSRSCRTTSPLTSRGAGRCFGAKQPYGSRPRPRHPLLLMRSQTQCTESPSMARHSTRISSAMAPVFSSPISRRKMN